MSIRGFAQNIWRISYPSIFNSPCNFMKNYFLNKSKVKGNNVKALDVQSVSNITNIIWLLFTKSGLLKINC